MRGVNSELAESSSDDIDIVPVIVDDAFEFFRAGNRSFDIRRCNRVEKCAIEAALALLFERGVDGVVDVVIVESDRSDAEGVGGTDCDDPRADGDGAGILSDERGRGDGTTGEIRAGAEVRRWCVRRGREAGETLRGPSGVSLCRERAREWLRPRVAGPRCGVRDTCRPIAICSMVGVLALCSEGSP